MNNPDKTPVNAEKARKRRRTAHVHVYVNENKPVTVPQNTLDALNRWLESEQNDDEVTVTPKNPTPGHAAAEAAATHKPVPGVCHHTPDVGKNLSSGVPTSTSDIGQRYMPDSTYPVHGDGARQMAASAGNAVSQYNTNRNRNNPGVAAFHPDLRQSSVSFNDVITRLRGVRANPGSTFIGQAGAFANTDSPPGNDGGNPRVALYDPCGEAGSYAGLSHPVAGDATSRANPTYASARQSATPPGNSHVSSSQSNAVSTAVAGKVSNLDLMKSMLFPNV